MKTEKEIRIYFMFYLWWFPLLILLLHIKKIRRFSVCTVLCTVLYHGSTCTPPYLPTLNHLKNRGSRGYLPTKNPYLPTTSTPMRQRSEDQAASLGPYFRWVNCTPTDNRTTESTKTKSVRTYPG